MKKICEGRKDGPCGRVCKNNVEREVACTCFSDAATALALPKPVGNAGGLFQSHCTDGREAGMS